MTEPDNIRTDSGPAPTAPRLNSAETAPDESSADTVTPASADPDETVGTGSAIALGCIAATLLLIVIGLVFLAIVALLN